VPQAKRLADPHPGLGQQRQQEPVPQMLACGQDRSYLAGVQGPRDPAGHRQPHRPRRDRLAPGHVMQERLIGTSADTAPGDQRGRHVHPVAGKVVIQAEHRREASSNSHRALRVGGRVYAVRGGEVVGEEAGPI
jgi:hypothetical protein